VGGWSGETLLDIQWAHAIAPNATIILVEANSDLNVDMTQAIDKAVAVLNAGYGGGVISMSFGGPESIDKTVADASFLNLNTKNISFIAASGDTPVPSQPATNPNVLAVGGTALFLDAQGNRVGGSTVTTGANGLPSGYTDPAVGASVEGGERPWFMSGAGISTVYATPTYQQNRGIFLPMRGTPDVCYNADPVTGYPVWNSAGGGGVAGWTEVGGTSAAAPQWAALVALANQYRAQKGQVKLGDQLVNKLYSLGGRGPDAYFNDIDAYGVLPVQNGYAYPAGTGWDLASGWGSPRARTLIPALADQALVFTNTTAKLSSASLTVFDPTVPMSVTNPGFTYVRTNTSGTIQGLNTLNFNPGTFTLLSTGNGSNTSTSTLTMFGLDSFGVGAAGNPIVLERIGNELSGSGQFLYTYTTSTTTGGTGGTGGTTTTTTTTVGGRLRFTGSIANGGVSLSFVTVDANGNEIKSSVYKDPVNPTAVVIRVIGKFTN
jgi:subtilase family serine protease